MIELSSCDPINHDDPQEPLASFPRISEPLSYDEFFREFLEKNRPCVFSSSFTQEWLAREDWVTPSNTPNVEFLRNHFGANFFHLFLSTHVFFSYIYLYILYLVFLFNVYINLISGDSGQHSRSVHDIRIF